MPLCPLFRTFSHPQAPLRSAHTAMEIASYRRIAHLRILLPLCSVFTATKLASYRR